MERVGSASAPRVPGMKTIGVPVGGGVMRLYESWQICAPEVGEQASGWTYMFG